MAIGPDMPARGVVATPEPLHQNQIAATIARLLGVDYRNTQPVGAAITSLFTSN